VGYVADGRVYHPSDVMIIRDDDPPAVEFAPRPRVYRELAEDTLAAEFEPLDPLPEMTP
jgi:hypothetical protein